MKKTRKGFTLVELLIVIVVIGILASMMMLSSSEAVSSAKASTIVSNLRNLKTAALALYNDNMDKYDAKRDNGVFNIDADDYNVFQYLNGKGDMPDKGDYRLVIVASDASQDTNGWYIIYNAAALKGEEGKRIRNKLAGRAGSLGLILINGSNNAPDGGKKYDGNDKRWVGIQVR